MPAGGTPVVDWVKESTNGTLNTCIRLPNTVKTQVSSIIVSYHQWKRFGAEGMYNPVDVRTQTISEDTILSSSGNTFYDYFSYDANVVYVKVWAQIQFKQKPKTSGSSDNKTYYYGGYGDDVLGYEGKSDWSNYRVWVADVNGWPRLPPTPEYEVRTHGLDSKGGTYQELKTWVPNITLDSLGWPNAVRFQIWDGGTVVDTFDVPVWNGKADRVLLTTSPQVANYVMTPGCEYFVRATSVRYGANGNLKKGQDDQFPLTYEGEDHWTEWVPGAQSGIAAVPVGVEWDDSGEGALTAVTTSSVKLKWKKPPHGKWTPESTFEILYSTNIKYVETESNAVQTISDILGTSFVVTGLEKGQTYYFKVRSKNDSGYGQSSSIKSIILGKKPSAPTTWSDTTTAKQGRKVRLYWVHNSEDSSIQKFAQLELYKDDVLYKTETFDTDSMPGNSNKDEEDKEVTSSYILDTSLFPNGAVIKWRVRTAGVLTNSNGQPEYGDWSITRTVEIYSKPELTITAPSVLKAFPLTIKLQSKPENQTPVSYSVSISAKNSYYASTLVGETYKVNAGEEIFRQYIDSSSHELELNIYPQDINLLGNNFTVPNQPGQEYVIKANVAMSNGLSEDAQEAIFTVAFESEMNGTFESQTTIDQDNLTAIINASYVSIETGKIIPDVDLYIYRRDYDGNYISLSGIDPLKDAAMSTGMPNNGLAAAFDPHPPLDNANYRIVALNTLTGEIDYSDTYPAPVGEIYAVIQWEESWPEYYTQYEGPGNVVQPTWNGTMLKIPWNLDISDSWKPQTSTVEYIGREHPVGYYGTQVGATSTWKTDVVKADREMIAKLRRLATYQGNVYVREPYGSGYWAIVQVSFSQDHTNVIVPVTLEITRVDGGV